MNEDPQKHEDHTKTKRAREIGGRLTNEPETMQMPTETGKGLTTLQCLTLIHPKGLEPINHSIVTEVILEIQAEKEEL